MSIEAALRRGAALLVSLAVTAGLLQEARATDKLTFHVDAARTGWNSQERLLTPSRVAGPRFGQLWSSATFDRSGATPPRLFATPLYVADVPAAGAVIYAATSTGFVYALRAQASPAAPAGSMLWRQQLTPQPCRRGSLGILGTPVIDRSRQRLYVSYCDEESLWNLAALDIRTGAIVRGWPVRLGAEAINAPGINRNGSNQFPAVLAHLQRSALNLSADGARLYVSFGGEPTSGWLVAVDTNAGRVASAFSATARTEEGVGGMWAAGGPALDERGHIYMSTGSSVLNTLANRGIAGVFPDSPGNWGQSVIELRDAPPAGLTLAGTYTPFNYCQAGARDMDLGASSPALIDLAQSSGPVRYLLALGGAKQGNAYLLDRRQLPGSLQQRQPCSTDASSDRSLLAPEPQPQFARRGPLNVFGPYTEADGMGDQARSRSTLAHWRNARGEDYLFLTGAAKTGPQQTVSAAPSLVRLRIVTARDRSPYLRFDRAHPDLVLQNPGSPVVSSHGRRGAIVWILDINTPRSASLYGPNAPRPVLYAIDAASLRLLWRSQPGELGPSGKYNEPTVVDGQVIVGTDRIQVFGLRGRSSRESSALAALDSSAATEVASDRAPTATPTDAAADLAAGRELFAARCQACHDSGQSGIPPTIELRRLKADLIVEKTLLGSMQTQALGLSERQIGQIALYLTQ